MPIEAAINVLNKDSSDIESYFSGFEELSYLHSYHELYKETKRLAQTWQYGKPIFQFREKNGLTDLYWDIHRSFTQFIISTHTAIEYLTTQLITEELSPDDRKLGASAIGELNQHRREKVLHNHNIISGTFRGKLQEFRGKRNDFAHDWGTHFNVDDHVDPLKYIEEGYEIVEKLVLDVYGERLETILEYLQECHKEPDGQNIREWTTFQVARKYVREYTWFIEMEPNIPSRNDKENLKNLEQALKERGFDPGDVREQGIFHRKGQERKGHLPAPMSVLGEYELNIPETVKQGNTFQVTLKFELDDEINLPLDDGPIKEVDYYGLLLVDGLVVERFPAEQKTAKAKAGQTTEFSLKHTDNEAGERNITFATIFETEHNYSTLIEKNELMVESK